MHKQRAVAYCRVSTTSNAQMHSLGYQTEYWKAVIADSDQYEYSGIYADAGIGGHSMNKRPQQLKMLQDAKEKRFDVIFTKSVARFARNTEELLMMVRQLRDGGIKVIFEKEQIDTFDPNSEIFLTIAASVAENDLKIYSENMRWSIRERYKNGWISVGNGVFGYTMNKETNTLEVVPKEAETVRYIFDLFLMGYGIERIADILTNEKRTNRYGKTEWKSNAIKYILRNEKYKGCSLCQKRVSEFGVFKYNENEATKYYIENAHEAIVSPEIFDKVQEEIARRANPKLVGGHTPSYTFSKMIKCTVCGHTYAHKVQNGASPWRKGVWVCHYQNRYGLKGCCNTRIKESVLEEKFVECFNEFITAKGDDDFGARQKQHLAELLAHERELNALKINRMIEIVDYNSEWKKLKAQIDELTALIEMREIRRISKSDYTPITEFQEEKVEKFLDHIEIAPNKVTFVFINGARISREYTNGTAGNTPGWLERRNARLAKAQEVCDGN